MISIDHVGIALDGYEELGRLDFFEKGLGLALSGEELVETSHARLRSAEIGESRLEFIVDGEGGDTISRFVSKRGQGVHHIALRVDSVDSAIRSLVSNGFDMVDGHPRTGSDGTRVAFVRPSSSNRILIELVERGGLSDER